MTTNISDEFAAAFDALHKLETAIFELQGEEVAKQKADRAIEITKKHNLIRKALRDVVKANALLGNAHYDHFLFEQS